MNITYQTLNIAGYKIKLGLDENGRVRDKNGNFFGGLHVPSCGVTLDEEDIAKTILRKIKLN